jgi:hypothetical protein
MRQIFVDTRDKIPGGTNSNFSILLPQTLSLGPGHQGRIDDFRLPVSIPTIYSGNNSIVLDMNGTIHTVFLTEGQYTGGPHLAGEIQAKLRAGPPGNWNVAYDGSKMSMNINCSNSFQFIGGTFMSRLLSRDHYYDGYGTYVFQYVSIQGLDMVYLCCSNFSNMDNVGPKGASDTLCAIPITAGFGSVQEYSMSTSVFFDIPQITTQQLSFQLRDRDYSILNIVAGISFTLTID